MAEEERILEVTPDFDGKRIDQCLAASFSDCSRSFLQKLLKDGKVSINGKTQKASSKVAAGDAVLRRPLDGLVVIGVVGYVVEEVKNAVVLHEGRLDLDLARGHGEGVFPAALVGELQIIAVLVSDGNGFQHIATVGFHRDRHGAARSGVLRADRHAAILRLA